MISTFPILEILVELFSNLYRRVNDASGMESFNGRIDEWDMSNARDLSWFMCNNIYFDQPIPYWNLGNVVEMHCFFFNSIFSQDISAWDLNTHDDRHPLYYSPGSQMSRLLEYMKHVPLEVMFKLAIKNFGKERCASYLENQLIFRKN